MGSWRREKGLRVSNLTMRASDDDSCVSHLFKFTCASQAANCNISHHGNSRCPISAGKTVEQEYSEARFLVGKDFPSAKNRIFIHVGRKTNGCNEIPINLADTR